MSAVLAVFITIIIALAFNNYINNKGSENEELLNNLDKYEQKERKE